MSTQSEFFFFPREMMTPSPSAPRGDQHWFSALPLVSHTDLYPVGFLARAMDTDPDWVRSFTPAKPTVNIDESDTDSFINLISDNDGDTATQETPAATPSSPTKPTKKKPRGPMRPRNELPFVAAQRLDESLTLLQAEDDELDLSGDVGAVGRVKVEGEDVVLDIKGTLYRATTYGTNSMCVVAVGDEDAKVTAVMNHAVVLRAEGNLFAADDGVLNGHVYDDEADEPLVFDGGGDAEAEKAKEGRPGNAATRKKGKPQTANKTISKFKTKAKGISKQGKPKKK